MTQIPLLVLAGGFGTRLKPVVQDVPKPLAPVNGRPFLEYLLKNWQQAGILDFIFLLHHGAGQILTYLESAFTDAAFNDCTYRAITEPRPLGTGGAVANAIAEFAIEGEFLVANADTWLPEGMKSMVGTTCPAMAVVRVPNAGRYGKVEVQEGMATAFHEKVTQPAPGCINAGIYRLHPEALAGWDGEFLSMETKILPELVKSGVMNAIEVRDTFIDIGVPKDYQYFQTMIAEQGI